jgi:hypothetical protein
MLPASRFGLDVFGDIVGRLVACNPDSPVRTDSELAAEGPAELLGPWKLAIFLYERSANSAFDMELSPCAGVE